MKRLTAFGFFLALASSLSGTSAWACANQPYVQRNEPTTPQAQAQQASAAAAILSQPTANVPATYTPRNRASI